MKKLSEMRRSKNYRLVVMLILLVILAILFFTVEKFKYWILGIMAILLAAIGMEMSGNDFDVEKLIETGSFSESRVQQTENGTWLIGECKKKVNFNCDNFNYQDEAQELFEACGGRENDIHGLDRDKDGIVCEANKKRPAEEVSRGLRSILGLGAEEESVETVPAQ